MVFDLIIGLLGMLCILVGFVLDEFLATWNQNTVRYNVINLVGSGLLIYYSITLNSIPFLILNIVWFGAAIVKLVKIEMKD